MPVKDSVSASQFNKRITIQNPVDTDDGQGGSSRTWNNLYSPMADIQYFPHGRYLARRWFAQQLYPTLNVIVQIRWQPAIQLDASMRVLFVKGLKTHVYQVLGIENVNEANVSLMMYCEELQAKGEP